MRQVGRPRIERLLAEPFREATGRILVAAAAEWDAQQVPLAEIARRITDATGRRVSPGAVRAMLERASGVRTVYTPDGAGFYRGGLGGFQ